MKDKQKTKRVTIQIDIDPQLRRTMFVRLAERGLTLKGYLTALIEKNLTQGK